MKKEYREGEDPFSFFDNKDSNSKQVKYNGIDAIVFREHGDYATIIAISGREGTWNEAVQYTKSMNGYWRLPSKEELIMMSPKLQPNNYWSYEEVDDSHAIYYHQENNESYSANKNRTFYILPLAIVRIAELE